MGYYAERSDRAPFYKARGLAEENYGTVVDRATAYEALMDGKGVFVVVMNASFEAAAFAHSKREWEAFHRPDERRPREYVVMDRDRAEEISGYKRAISSGG